MSHKKVSQENPKGLEEAEEAVLGKKEMGDKFLSPKELSILLRVSKPWPYIMVRRGLLPHYKMGKVIRFRLSDVEAFLAKSRVEKGLD